MYYYPSHEYLSKNLTKIIIVMQKIWFATSPDSTTITPEKLSSTIDQMDHELPTMF